MKKLGIILLVFMVCIGAFWTYSCSNQEIVEELNIEETNFSDANREGEEVDSSDGEEKVEEPAPYFPYIIINTENSAAIEDKENYISCTVSVTNTDEQYCLTDAVAGIRGRGNSSWAMSPKKPYKLKFDKKLICLVLGKQSHGYCFRITAIKVYQEILWRSN